jgi:hypothetical protein
MNNKKLGRLSELQTHKHMLRKKRIWKVVLDEKRNIFQRINDHPGTKKSHIYTGATKDYSLVPVGKKPALAREVIEGLYSREGAPCLEEI